MQHIKVETAAEQLRITIENNDTEPLIKSSFELGDNIEVLTNNEEEPQVRQINKIKKENIYNRKSLGGKYC